MPKYSVKLPIAGYAYVDVEADNEDAAIDVACETVELDHIEEWGAHRQIVQGNVFYGNCNEAEAELIDEDK